MVIYNVHLQAMMIVIDGSRQCLPILLNVSHSISQLRLLVVRLAIDTVGGGHHLAKNLSCSRTSTSHFLCILFDTAKQSTYQSEQKQTQHLLILTVDYSSSWLMVYENHSNRHYYHSGICAFGTLR